MDAVNFNIFPTDKIIEAIISVKEEVSDTTVASFANYGYKNTSILKNLGTIFVAILALLAVIVLALLARVLVKKFSL